ncbi:uncharacterized protein LOC131251021 [Magnolia sinica]|uniref:uncharacterized protein LOC131251021 n=1 Tax=Magnolia sinica TaxID=86752 RepID=UPI00265B3A23|nr:uncharacterized protein LOC131251021 [Magnolia sinica]XP_058107449.1 uncharacterized protein LOC131251021 [Magnolia sinica]
MRNRSKDLLKLEEQNEPSSIESSLLVCNNNDPLSQKKKCYTNKNGSEKILTTSIPTSQVLGRVKDFLGVMAEANKRLQLDAQEKSQVDYDIEVLTGNEREYIEMDLVLGVADLHTPEAVVAAEAALVGSQLILPSSVCSNSSDTEDSDSNDDDDDDDDNNTCLPNKLRKQNSDGKDSSSSDQPKKRPKITELH